MTATVSSSLTIILTPNTVRTIKPVATHFQSRLSPRVKIFFPITSNFVKKKKNLKEKKPKM